MTTKNSKNIDIFRDTYLRYMGYANEVGESFRPLVNVNWVRFSYVLASGYVIADSVDKMYKAQQRLKQSQNQENDGTKRILKAGLDSVIWQSFASVIIPGFTINRIVKVSKHGLLKRATLNHSAFIQKSLPTAIGLISIPFIIHPIDNFVSFAMDNSLRPYMGIKGNH